MSDSADTPQPAPTPGRAAPGAVRRGSDRRCRAGVSAAFGLQGFTLSMLLTLLPQFRDHLDLSDGIIVAVVVLASVIAGIGSILAELLASHTDSRTTLRTGFAVIVAAVAGVIVSPGIVVFFAGFAVYGIGLGMVDASANMQGVALQHRAGRSIMSSFYACWSVGAIAGALWVAVFAEMDAGLLTTLSAGIGLVAACTLVMSPFLLPTPRPAPPGRTSERDLPPISPHPAIPLWPFLTLGGAMGLFYAIDFAIGNWSALFMTDVVLSDSGTAALAMACYQSAALLSRLTGDLWVRRFGEIPVVRVGAAIAVAGTGLVVGAQSVPMALTGFLIVGLGAPVVAPLCFGAAGRLAPDGQADAVIARLNIFNYAGTLVGGGIVGGVAALTSLRIAFVVPLVFAVGLALLAPAFRARAGPPAPSAPADPAARGDHLDRPDHPDARSDTTDRP